MTCGQHQALYTRVVVQFSLHYEWDKEAAQYNQYINSTGFVHVLLFQIERKSGFSENV